jgi:hypothetical protein
MMLSPDSDSSAPTTLDSKVLKQQQLLGTSRQLRGNEIKHNQTAWFPTSPTKSNEKGQTE